MVSVWFGTSQLLAHPPFDPRSQSPPRPPTRYTHVRAAFGECEGPRPVTYKILRQPTTDPVFQSLCAGTTAHCVFAHIRAASGATAITHYNNHPFAFGRLAFMHNGSVAHFDEIKRALALELSDAAHARVKGTTDSEALAALFFTYLEQQRGPEVWEQAHPLAEMKTCLERAIRRVLELQRAAMAAVHSRVTTSPRYSRETAMYLPLRGSQTTIWLLGSKPDGQ